MAAHTRFFTTSEGVRIAYATIGQGPPLVSIPPWLSHLELLWDAPAFRNFNEALARDFTVILYDRYGCGLSDREPGAARAGDAQPCSRASLAEPADRASPWEWAAG